MTLERNYKEPRAGCRACARLFAFRREVAAQNPEWFNAPVPDYGASKPQLIVVGLAPGLKGGNRTGIPFQGDFSGLLLSRALVEAGLARYRDEAAPEGGIWADHVLITNIVRCVPPQNKVTAQEIKNCNPFFVRMLKAHRNASALFAVGRQAHDAILRAYGVPISACPFAHDCEWDLPDGKRLFSSYHCSRYNIQTKRLSEEEFCRQLKKVAAFIRAQDTEV
ncbi:uracil-DNA glycosylase [Pseudovibrio sp. SPO723]|uniref:uracil-DNA glycosylase n=1 Tax=Nesiotobacter zosterae TaxID=392721 RepID=UPI0029C2D876|nr:uracil-DNA glycosylase [Pseudovibrio sp. SPO723]MDX5592498.1 uracil-DNA glycosylase [Pseudovibrio sp. SPO723]